MSRRVASWVAVAGAAGVAVAAGGALLAGGGDERGCDLGGVAFREGAPTAEQCAAAAAVVRLYEAAGPSECPQLVVRELVAECERALADGTGGAQPAGVDSVSVSGRRGAVAVALGRERSEQLQLLREGGGWRVAGGLFDALAERGNGAGNEIIEERVEDNEEQVDSNPRATTPREELVRDYYSLAASQATTNSTGFPPDAQDELRRAATHWDAYLELADRPDPSLARVAIQIYGQAGLNQPDSALQAARIVANDNKRDVSAYLLLLQYATLAGDERTEQLATQKALALARTERERKAVQRQIERFAEAVETPSGGDR